MTCVQTNALGETICGNVLQTLDTYAPKPGFWIGTEQFPGAGARAN